MGSTRPRSVISPVMARSLCTAMPERAETMEVAMATPAEGPSLGVAPSGTWTWMSFLANMVGVMPKLAARDCTYDLAACTDSRMTSPNLPVMVILPLPGTITASTASNSPPTSVQASPVVTPTRSSSSTSP